MTNKETIKKNIELTFDFVRQIIENPKIAEQLPDKCDLDFIEKDFTSLTEKELTKKHLVKVNHTFDIIKEKESRFFKRNFSKSTTPKQKTI